MKRRLKKFKSDTFGGTFSFNAGSENSDLSDGHQIAENKKSTDIGFSTYFKTSKPVNKSAIIGHQTDPRKVLREMMQEPGLNEKIFKMFS